MIRAVYANIDDEELGEVMFSLSEFVHEFDDFDTEDDPDWDENSRDLFSVRLSCFLKALKIKFDSGQPILQAIIVFIETEFRKNEVKICSPILSNISSQINLDITRMLKRVYIELDTGKPLLIVESGSLDTWCLALNSDNSELLNVSQVASGKVDSSACEETSSIIGKDLHPMSILLHK